MSVSKYDAASGIRWLVDVWLDYPNGSRWRLRKRNIPTREMALALERKAQVEAFEGRFFEARRVKRLTIEEIWNAYEPVTRQRNDSWQSDTGRAKHLLRHWATKEVNELTRRDVEGYISIRLTEISKRTGGCLLMKNLSPIFKFLMKHRPV